MPNRRRKADPPEANPPKAVTKNTDSHGTPPPPAASSSRRKFIQGSGLILAGSAIAGPGLAHANATRAIGSDTIKVGIVGCGYRGTAAAMSMIRAAANTEAPHTFASDRPIQVVALADVFDHALQSTYRTLNGRTDACQRAARFPGLDGFHGVMAGDADIVILATPACFRPDHFGTAIESGKHVFMDGPMAVDIAGVRSIQETHSIARQKQLSVSVGFPRRHDARTRECVEVLRQGILGEPRSAHLIYRGSLPPLPSRRGGDSQRQHELRHWQHFPSLGGDMIHQRLLESLDIVNWVMDDHPVLADGAESPGSCQTRQEISFTYPSGMRLSARCEALTERGRQRPTHSLVQRIEGPTGWCDLASGTIRDSQGKRIWQSQHPPSKGHGSQSQHANLIESLRTGTQRTHRIDAAAINEPATAEQVIKWAANELPAAIEATLTSILGSQASSRGDRVNWSEVASTS